MSEHMSEHNLTEENHTPNLDANVTCPDCKGKGCGQGFAINEDGSCRFGTFDCFRCKGSGEIPEYHLIWIEEGKKMRDDRVARGVSLMEEAKSRGLTSAQLSSIERGIHHG